MNSRIYAGHLVHARTTPRAYRFKYGVFYLSVDLDEIPMLDRRLRLFSYNRGHVLSLQDADHMAEPGRSLRDSVRTHLAAKGIDVTDARITLLTNARILNYVFNPVSFYFVHGRRGELRHVVAEVHNTSGQRHVYDLPRLAGDSSVYRAEAGKEFYVSPFIEMQARYEFAFSERADGGINVRIDEFRPQRDAPGNRPFFRAVLTLQSQPLNDAALARVLVRYPLMTLRTIALIHWHGLKLWLRGVRYTPNPDKARAR